MTLRAQISLSADFQSYYQSFSYSINMYLAIAGEKHRAQQISYGITARSPIIGICHSFFENVYVLISLSSLHGFQSNDITGYITLHTLPKVPKLFYKITKFVS